MTAVFFVVILHLCLSTITAGVVIAEDGDGGICRGSSFEVRYELPYCVYIGGPTTWRKASERCHRQNGVLHTLTGASLMISASGRMLSDYMVSNGMNRTWVGLHVAEGRLVQDIVEDPGVDTSSGQYFWDEGQPAEGKECGSASLSFGEFMGFSELPDDITGTTGGNTGTTGGSGSPGFIAGRRKRQSEFPLMSRLALTDCSEELPYVCISNPIPLNMGTVPMCKNSSVGSYSLRQCYSISREAVTYDEADRYCQEAGGKIAGVRNNFKMSVVRSALLLLRRSLVSPDDRPQMISNTWINTTGRECQVLDEFTSDGHHWDCDLKAFPLCEIPAQYDEVDVSIEIERARVSEVLNEGEVREVLISQEDIYLPEDIRPSLICRVDGYDSRLHKVVWYSNGEVVQPWLYKTNDTTIELPLSNSLLRRQNTITIQKYYWCEVTSFQRSWRSDKVFVRLIDLEVHAGSISANSSTLLSPTNYTLYNLMGTTSRNLESILNAYQYQEETGPAPLFVLPYKFRDGGSILDFLAIRERPTPRGFDLELLASNAKEELIMGYSTSRGLKYFLPDSVIVRSIDYCFAFVYEYRKTGQKFEIPQSKVGVEYNTPVICGIDKEPMGKVSCMGDKMFGGYWGRFKFNTACDFSDVQGSSIAVTLKNLSEIAVTNDNMDDILQSVNDITDNTTMAELDLLYVTAILENVANTSMITNKVMEDMYSVYNKVLESSEKNLEDSQERGRVANRVLEVMDEVSDKLVAPPSGHQRFVSDAMGTDVWDLSNSALADLVIGLQLSEDGFKPILQNESMVSIFTKNGLKYGETEAAILFPKDFIRQVVDDAKGKDIRLTMNIHKDTKLFMVSEKTSTRPVEYVLNSKVIAARILVDGQEVKDLKGAEVTTVFMPQKAIPVDLRRNMSACGYWNFTGNNDTGTWSTSGCRYKALEEGRDVCACDHLTNFAVLLDFYGQNTLAEEHALPLSIITIIGLSLSILGLSLTVLSFVTFKKLRETRPQQTLFNLALAELCSWIIFLAGINQTQDHVGCIVVAALLHYFIIASFMWMLMEALLHYLMFVKVLGTYFNKYMLKTTIPAWGIPIIPVAVILAVDYNLYRGGDSFCWMSLAPFYYGFALPVGLIILANIIIYIMVVVSICRRSKVTCQSSQSERARNLVNIRAAFFCFVLLGLSWTFGYLTLSGARIAFQYIFTISTTIQGFLIFILFTLRDNKVRDSWRQLCCKKKRKEPPSTGRVTSAGSLPLHKSTSNGSAESNTRSNVTGVSSVPYYHEDYQEQFDDFRKFSVISK